ncbi:MAG: hypothetical protein ACI9DH_000967 [Halioglobus sp.]|jgi:uncharacterized protein (DUF1499 family)
MNQPVKKSNLVSWGGIAALILLIGLPISVLLVRSGIWQQGLMIYAVCCAGAVLLLLLFIILALLPAFKSYRGDIFKRGVLLLPGVILLAGLLAGQGDIPPIHDISTDTLDPPTFASAAEMRGDGANSLTIKPESIAAQIASYPDIATMRSSEALEENYDKAISAATALGWDIYHQDLQSGAIEAVDSTAIMNFKDDIVIRLREADSETLIDVRSVSRVGVSDMGANAKRIRAFQKQFRS